MIRPILIAVLTFALIGGGSAFAHSPEGEIFIAFQWPAGLEPIMDGVGNEYEIIPEPYWQVTEQFPDTQGGRDIDPSNFDAKATITYSTGTNMIYAFSEVFDDVSIPPDTWQFLIDADHSGGDCYPDTDDNARFHASACQQYEVYNHIPGEEGDDPVHFFWGTATWLPEVGWYNITCTFEGDKDAAGTVYREISFMPLDDLNSPAGQNESVIHTLVENEIMGLGYNWMDYDEVGRETQGGGWQAFYNLTQHDRMYRSGDGACDFFLAEVDATVDFNEMGTAVDATTWGRIKAGFVQ